MRVVLATLQAQTNHTIDVLPQLGLAALRRLDFYFHPAREPDDASAASLGVLREAVWRCLRDLAEETYDELRLVVTRQRWRSDASPFHGMVKRPRPAIDSRPGSEQNNANGCLMPGTHLAIRDGIDCQTRSPVVCMLAMNLLILKPMKIAWARVLTGGGLVLLRSARAQRKHAAPITANLGRLEAKPSSAGQCGCHPYSTCS